jgi:hypothetical protein
VLDIFIRVPWLSFGVAALFFGASWRVRSLLLVATSIVWLLYGVYEYLMHFRVLCTGECNIRVDLLLIYPILALLSISAIVTAAKQWHRQRDQF